LSTASAVTGSSKSTLAALICATGAAGEADREHLVGCLRLGNAFPADACSERDEDDKTGQNEDRGQQDGLVFHENPLHKLSIVDREGAFRSHYPPDAVDPLFGNARNAPEKYMLRIPQSEIVEATLLIPRLGGSTNS
jgi:hypothetical protein